MSEIMTGLGDGDPFHPRLARPLPERPSKLRRRVRQRRGTNAFAHPVVHRQVAYGVKLHRPDGVIVGVRPLVGRWSHVIAGEQPIYGPWDVIVLPAHQHGLIGELAAVEEKITG